MQTSVVISYCSLDKKFISKLLEQVLFFSDDVTIVYYDKLLNGTPEPVEEIESIISANSEKVKGLKLYYTADNSSRYFHNLARWEGIKTTKYDHVLFLDGDEIPEGELFREILKSNQFDEFDSIYFALHWYFRSAKYQAIQTRECGPVLVKKSIITKELIFTESERWAFRQTPGLKSINGVKTKDGPFMHHYSWVRTKEEMLTKVSSWGHKNDRNWAILIEEEFSREFSGKDFVHGYSYNIVEDKFGLNI